MNNAPLPASLPHVLEVRNARFVAVGRVSGCCCSAITSQNQLFPLPFLAYIHFQRMGLWSRTADRKVFHCPDCDVRNIGLADIPSLPLSAYGPKIFQCRRWVQSGSPGPFSGPSAVAVKYGLCIRAWRFSGEPGLRAADGVQCLQISHHGTSQKIYAASSSCRP